MIYEARVYFAIKFQFEVDILQRPPFAKQAKCELIFRGEVYAGEVCHNKKDAEVSVAEVILKQLEQEGYVLGPRRSDSGSWRSAPPVPTIVHPPPSANAKTNEQTTATTLSTAINVDASGKPGGVSAPRTVSPQVKQIL